MHWKQKIQDQSRIGDTIRTWRNQGDKIVFTNGCFDLFHAGHADSLYAAASLGDRLVVGINDDRSVQRLKGPVRPLQPLHYRMEVLAALGFTDAVIPFSEDTPEELIKHILPDVLVKGGDYRIDDIAGADAVTRNGGHVVILPLITGLSTTDLIDRIRRI